MILSLTNQNPEIMLSINIILSVNVWLGSNHEMKLGDFWFNFKYNNNTNDSLYLFCFYSFPKGDYNILLVSLM